jgi:hypothetical protein
MPYVIAFHIGHDVTIAFFTATFTYLAHKNGQSYRKTTAYIPDE